MRSHRAMSTGVALLLVPAGVVAASALPTQTTSAPTASTCVAAPQACILVDGVGASLALPLLRTTQAGSIGPWDGASMGVYFASNTGQAVLQRAVVNGQTANVVPSAGHTTASWGPAGFNSGAIATVVDRVSGRSYRYVRYVGRLGVNVVEDPGGSGWKNDWSVTTTVLVWPTCTMRGTHRVPSTDCGNGTEARAFGTTSLPVWAARAGETFDLTIPLTYALRSVDRLGRPLTRPTFGSGHWSLSARLDPNAASSLWSTEWYVGGVGSAWQAGASYVPTWRTRPVDGAGSTTRFQTGPYA